jgi:PPK2 family polyphosphate:nucleotide phosphotransferase
MIKLSEIPTSPPDGLTKANIKKEFDAITKEIASHHYIMAAQKKYSMLIVFQGMDASGKDGATRKIFKYCSPSAMNAVSYKKPTEEEFDHDFLWRINQNTPRKGSITIFNRSHYEDILIQRVHNWIDDKRVSQRIDAINAFEEILERDNNTTVLKFYMHISESRQKEKLQERIDVPRKNWKHNPGDWDERKHWERYMFCYEDAINRSKIPWIIAPVDSRWYRDYFIATKVLETLKTFTLELPGLQEE